MCVCVMGGMSTFVHLQLSMVLLSSDSFPPFII